MQLHKHLLKSILGKAALATAMLGGFLLFGGTTGAQAGELRPYERPVVRYEHRGFYSPRADYWRYERHEAFVHGWRDRFGCWHRY